MEKINLVGKSGNSKAICKNVQFNIVEDVSPNCSSEESLQDEFLLYNY